MLRQERVEDEQEALRLALVGWQSEIWTAMPGILQSFDAEKLTCVVQPAIKGVWRLKDGTTKTVTLPQCLDVPVQFIGGGAADGFVLTFPMKKDDEGLIVFASRCIDAWWQNGGIQEQPELRLHSLSDGFFIPGFRSVPRPIANFNTTDAELRNEAGDVKVRLKSDQLILVAKNSTVTLKQDEIDIVATAIKFTGDVTITGKLTSTDDTSLGGGAQAVKLADGSNATKVKAT